MPQTCEKDARHATALAPVPIPLRPVPAVLAPTVGDVVGTSEIVDVRPVGDVVARHLIRICRGKRVGAYGDQTTLPPPECTV